MRHALVLSCFAVLAWSPSALALELPPFDPEQRIYLVPDDFRFPTQAVRQAAGAVEHPVYVVVYEQVIDGSIQPGHESETEDAIEALWAEWRTAAGLSGGVTPGGFDGAEGSLVLLAMDDREVRVVTGSRWDAELGLHNDALLPIIDQHFMPKAQAGDYDGGLAALVRGLDGAITSKQGALEAAMRESARRLAQLEEERVAEELRRTELKAAAKRWSIIGGLGFLLALLAGLVGFFRLAAVRARRGFDEALARLLAQLDAADANFADFRIDVELRDRIVELRLKGPVTTALYEQVSGSLDEIQAGLAGMRRHVELCRAETKAGLFATTPWLEGQDRLEGPLVIRTEQTQDRLFPAPSQALEVEPAAFMASLEERFATAKVGWKRVLDAVEASLHKASADLPRDDLEAMLAQLDQAGLPAVWVQDHPLMDDPEACWAGLDAVRREDPAAYLDALEDHLEHDDALEALVDELIAGVARAAELVAEAQEPSVEGLDTVVDEEERDPAPMAAQVHQLHARLLDIAHARQEPDPEALHATFDQLGVACAELVDRKRRLLASVERAPGLVAEAQAMLEELEGDYAASRALAKELAGEHTAASLSQAWVEVAEAREDLEQCRAAALQAKALLDQRRHVAAEATAERSLSEHGEAVQDLAELCAVLEELERAKAEAEAMFASLQAKRDASANDLAGFGGFGDVQLLVEGDALRQALEAEWRQGVPQDWSVRRESARAVLGAWAVGVGSARTAYRAEQARLAAIRQAEERRRRDEERRRQEAERARQRQRSSSRSSSTRSSFSSVKRSSSRSSSSSSRSSGRSYSSSSRSAGRSTRSSSRSGGRKF